MNIMNIIYNRGTLLYVKKSLKYLISYQNALGICLLTVGV